MVNCVLKSILTQWPLGEGINSEIVISKQTCCIISMGIFCAITLRTKNKFDDMSTLVQVMACCCQAASHYRSQCWPRSTLPYGISKPQCVNRLYAYLTLLVLTPEYAMMTALIPWLLMPSNNGNWQAWCTTPCLQKMKFCFQITCAISVSRNCIKCKFRFMFPELTSAWQGLRWIHHWMHPLLIPWRNITCSSLSIYSH